MLIVTAAQMRELDRATIAAGTPGWTLMQRAGQGATQVLLDAFPRLRRKRVVIVCGKGNNGGDGYVIARALKKRGVAVEVFLLGEEKRVEGDAALALRSWRRAGGRIRPLHTAADIATLQQRLEGAVCAVDAIFGTGLKGDVMGPAADVITLLNACGVPLFAVDIPSGLDSDTGFALGCAVQAEVTATFACPKIGQVVHPGSDHCGRLAVIDIGIDDEALARVEPRTVLLDADRVAALVPRREPTAHKGDCGHVLIIAGGRGKTGAAMLAARAAARAGSGLVTAAVAASQQPLVAGGLLEAMTDILADTDGEIGFDASGLARVVRDRDVIVCGPGIGTGDGARATVAWLLAQSDKPLVLDADGLNCLAAMLRGSSPPAARASRDLVLTPHPGEMARLSGRSTAEVQRDRLGIARSFAAAHDCVLVLKGAGTVIAAPDGRAAVNSTGNPGMASGGMGDVLAGVIGALIGQGLSAFDAASVGVYLHGLAADMAAADLGTIGLLASDVIEALPRAIRASTPE